HNIAASADGRFYYISIAHGVPYGTLWKMAVDGDTLVGRAPLELFPTTVALTPDGELAFVANSDFHGDHPRVNVVSVVHTPTMTTIANLPACDMPHGVKSNHAGTLVYVSCMHSDELLEIDVATLAIARRVPTGTGDPMDHSADGHCSPTYVSVSPDDRRIYLACNHGNTLQIRDAASLRLLSEVEVGPGAYNVGTSPDGRFVVVTNKKDQSVSIVDPHAGRELARVPVTKPVVHGVAFSPDGRFAYISAESVGADPGAVDMLDLTSRRIIATIPVPAQPTGITIVTVPVRSN
ncbi:MAG: YncE family protein, partial [Gemmatimonadales bacterium]